MSIPDNSFQTESVARNSLREEVTKRILINIFKGQLPSGRRLVIQKLATRFGVSTTPIRESLVFLEAAGLVQSAYNQGVVVRPFGVDQLREICQVRRILETEAARCACGQINSDKLAEIRRETLKLSKTPRSDDWSEKALDIDARLHSAIAGGCGSARLAEEIQRYAMLVNTIAEIAGNRHEVQARAFDEHVRIIDELLTGNADGVAQEMASHINNTARDLAEIMFSQ